MKARCSGLFSSRFLRAALRNFSLLLAVLAVGGCSYWRELSQAVWPDDTTESDEIVAAAEPETSSEQLEREVAAPPVRPQVERADEPAAVARPPVRQEERHAAAPGSYNPESAVLPFPPRVAVVDTGTFTSGIVTNIRADLTSMQNALQTHSSEAATIKAELQTFGERFYGLVAAVEARLQDGTTASNPILVEQWNEARYQLDQTAMVLSRLGQIRNNAATDAGVGGFLLDNAAQALTLPGSVEADRRQLKALQVEVGSTILIGDALARQLGEDVHRQSVFLRNGEDTLTLMARAIKDGVPYGRSANATPAEPPPATAAKRGKGSSLLVIKADEGTSETASMQVLYDAVTSVGGEVGSFEVQAVLSKGSQSSKALSIFSRAQRAAAAIVDFGISPDRVFVTTKYDKVPRGEIRVITHG